MKWVWDEFFFDKICIRSCLSLCKINLFNRPEYNIYFFIIFYNYNELTLDLIWYIFKQVRFEWLNQPKFNSLLSLVKMAVLLA